MNKGQEHWAKSGWAISIGTALFSLLLTMGYDYLKQIPVLTTVSFWLKWILSTVCAILNFNIKVWWIIVTIIIGFVIIYLIDKFFSNKNTESYKPDFYNYKEDKLKKWRWSWNWVVDHKQKSWVISNLKAHCPDCDTQLIPYYDTFSGTYYNCPRCNFNATDYQCEDPAKIEILILDNVRRRKSNSL
jgi:hypothetical protein